MEIRESKKVVRTEPMDPCPQPRRYKLALVTFAGLLAPVYFLPPALETLLSGPRIVTVVVVVGGTVALMTYVIMPLLTRLSRNWLFEKPRANS